MDQCLPSTINRAIFRTTCPQTSSTSASGTARRIDEFRPPRDETQTPSSAKAPSSTTTSDDQSFFSKDLSSHDEVHSSDIMWFDLALRPEFLANQSDSITKVGIGPSIQIPSIGLDDEDIYEVEDSGTELSDEADFDGEQELIIQDSDDNQESEFVDGKKVWIMTKGDEGQSE